jgi:hypothetical protein
MGNEMAASFSAKSNRQQQPVGYSDGGLVNGTAR